MMSRVRIPGKLTELRPRAFAGQFRAQADWVGLRHRGYVYLDPWGSTPNADSPEFNLEVRDLRIRNSHLIGR